MRRWRILLASCWLAAGPLAAQPLSFGLFGDTPYDEAQRAQLPQMLDAMGREPLAFVVHDGDFKSGSTLCSDAVFDDRLALFSASVHPLIFVPGDNEWTDCHRANNGGYDPLERLQALRTRFFADDLALGRRPLRLQRQSADPQFVAYRENVRWEAGGALFVGLNLPGSDNNYAGRPGDAVPSPEFLARLRANRAWLDAAFALARERGLRGLLIVIQANPGLDAETAGHARSGYREFLDQLRRQTQAFAGQVVLVHGDTHVQRIDQPMLDAGAQQLVANFTRVETFGSPQMGWILGTVDPSDPKVFRFVPRAWPPAGGR